MRGGGGWVGSSSKMRKGHQVKMEEEEAAGLRRADLLTAGRTSDILVQTQEAVEDLDLQGRSKPH